MPWLVGIDEAGYGPNLGPMVQAAIAIRAPSDQCIWQQLQTVVRKMGRKSDDRIIVDDSKLMFTQHLGLARLEYALYSLLHDEVRQPLGSLIQHFGCDHNHDDLAAEAWFEPEETGPIDGDIDEIQMAGNRFHPLADRLGIRVRLLGLQVTTARRFNQLVDHYQSKAGPLGDGLSRLLQRLPTLAPGEPMSIVIDKQGGRNAYAPLLQSALPDCWFRCDRESSECSQYCAVINGAPAQFRFIPRADQESFPVALASMLAKYLRERFMLQFNRYWQKHVPGIRPTAGYPVDAKRYFGELKPVLEKLQLDEEVVWRKR